MGGHWLLVLTKTPRPSQWPRPTPWRCGQVRTEKCAAPNRSIGRIVADWSKMPSNLAHRAVRCGVALTTALVATSRRQTLGTRADVLLPWGVVGEGGSNLYESGRATSAGLEY